MIIKVPVTEVTVGERIEDSIVNIRREAVIGRITLAKAKKMFPFDCIISVKSNYVKYDVEDDAVVLLIKNASKNAAE